METLALSFTSGWASGINSYLVVLVLGIADRIEHLDRIPDVLGSWPVLGIAAFMYAFEFVADKIPYVDSLWDAVSTFIRPVVGAVLGVLIAGDSQGLDQSLNQVVGGLVGGGGALGAHVTKAGTRLAVNTSPEPFTNIGLSVGEDGVVLAVMAFALAHPVIAAAIALVLMVAGLVVLWLLMRAVRRGWRRLRAWWERRTGSSAPEPAG
ncbi:MAG TPA: DUF4126 family protein [Nocardioides sp.]|nr:DUF4126 family protein [Nocardioides sp.]